MSRNGTDVELTAEQQREAERIADVLNARSRVLNRRMAELLAGKGNRELLGETEFQVRDMVHELGAAGIETALEERKKRGTADPATSAPGATAKPASSDTHDAG